jgi:hypothetical protein
MTHDGMARRNKNYGDSPVRRSGVPIASSVLESCSPMPTLAARTRPASATRGTASRLPFGSRVEPWPPQPSCVPRDPAHAVPRVVDATFHRCERRYHASSLKPRRFSPRRSREETRSVPRRTLLGRSIGKGRPTRLAIRDGSADSWVAGSASLRPRLKHADRAPG